MRKVAFITGSTRGIGLAIAEKLCELNYDIALNGKRVEKEVDSTLELLRSKGSSAVYVRGDISSEHDRRGIVEKIKSEYGRLDLLVNNAGVAPAERKDILESTEESFDRVLKTNLYGPYFLSQAVSNWMIQQKKSDEKYKGIIINITSVSSKMASLNRGEYCVSKAGLSMMTKLFALRLAEHQIPVYEIQPGIILTDMTSAVKEKYDKLIEEGLIPQMRWGFPEDVSKIVAALCSADSSYSTGSVFMVDGGLSIPSL